MIKQPAIELGQAALSEDAIAAYLHDNADFFERHPALLAGLRIPHERGGVAVSLVERQVLTLRKKNQQYETKLREFVSVAQANDALSKKIHTLSCRLISARGAVEVFDALELSLREDFGASNWIMVCTRADVPELTQLSSRHLRLIDRNDTVLKTFDSFFEAAKPRCGQVRDSQREYLFGNDATEIGSVALIPLGPNASYGLLAIGSHDVERFQPTMSTDYLTKIGQLISEAVGAL